MKLPISVVATGIASRRGWFERYGRPSIQANHPKEIIVLNDVFPCPKARNMGLKLVTQPFTIFVDDDVILGRDCLEKMLEALQEFSWASFAYCRYTLINLSDCREIPPIQRMMSARFSETALKSANYIDTSSLIRTEDCPRWDEQLSAFLDWDLWLQMVGQGKKGVLVPEMLFYKFHLDRGLSARVAAGEINPRAELARKWGLDL